MSTAVGINFFVEAYDLQTNEGRYFSTFFLFWSQPVACAQEGIRGSTPFLPPLTIEEEMNFSIFKRSKFSSHEICRNCYHAFLLCPTFLLNLEKFQTFLTAIS